jgi:hypothetical protein
MKARYLFILVGIMALILSACSGAESDRGALQSAEDVAAGLQDQGLDASVAEQLETDLFSVPAAIVNAGGESIQVYEYANEATAQADAALVDASGSSIGGSQPFWVDMPHFFSSGNLIVLYVGSDGGVLSALEALLGSQYAGR